MAVSYTKLWKILIDKKMSKADLRCAAHIIPLLQEIQSKIDARW